MKDKRFVEDAEPYKLYYMHNLNTIYVGDGLLDVPKKSFCYSPIFDIIFTTLKIFKFFLLAY